jgi:hypothetical protein
LGGAGNRKTAVQLDQSAWSNFREAAARAVFPFDEIAQVGNGSLDLNQGAAFTHPASNVCADCPSKYIR